MKIRVATVGWSGGQATETAEDIVVGIKVPWIELDGQRITDVVSVKFEVSNQDFTTPQAVIDLIGPIEIVYLDGEGNELKTEERDAESLPDKLDAHSEIQPL